MPRGDHGSRWGGVCLPAWIGSRVPHWEPLSVVPRPQTGQRGTGRRGWRCGEQSCPRCLHTPPGGLQRGPLCCGTLGSNNWCCGMALPASTAGSSYEFLPVTKCYQLRISIAASQLFFVILFVWFCCCCLCRVHLILANAICVSIAVQCIKFYRKKKKKKKTLILEVEPQDE